MTPRPVRARPSTALIALAAACGGDSPTPPGAAHPLVGTYAIEAMYTTLTPNVRGGVQTPAAARLSGTVVVGDGPVLSGGLTTFADVRLTASFCAAPGACGPADDYAGSSSHSGLGGAVTLDFSNVVGARTVHFEGPLAGDSIAGLAWYQVGNARYDGSFVARRRR